MNEFEELKETLAKISTAWNEYFAYKYDIKLKDYQYMQKLIFKAQNIVDFIDENKREFCLNIEEVDAE